MECLTRDLPSAMAVSKLDRRSLLAGGAALACRSAFGSERGIAWPKGAAAAVSLTYDDGYDSQLDHVVPALSAAGLKATFFLTVENIEERVTDWRKLTPLGHEVGNHTMSHPCALASYGADDYLRREIEPAEHFLDQNFGAGPRFFAYPCGFPVLGQGAANAGRERYRKVLQPRFLGARTVDGGPNDPAILWKRRFLLNAYQPTYDADQIETAQRYLRGAITGGAWAILVFHEVLPRRKGAGDTSIALHQRILEWIVGQPLWCAPMGQVFGYITDRMATARAVPTPLLAARSQLAR